jgi:hypothetical protein
MEKVKATDAFNIVSLGRGGAVISVTSGEGDSVMYKLTPKECGPMIRTLALQIAKDKTKNKPLAVVILMCTGWENGIKKEFPLEDGNVSKTIICGMIQMHKALAAYLAQQPQAVLLMEQLYAQRLN